MQILAHCTTLYSKMILLGRLTFFEKFQNLKTTLLLGGYLEQLLSLYLILLHLYLIGRFYRCSDLHRLVELILLSYTRQPVDFIMHHFDVLQMADQFREFRRMPPLIEHIGAKSTIDVESVYIYITFNNDVSTNTYYTDISY